MKMNDPRGILLSDLVIYNNDVPLYNTTFFITYYDVVNNKKISTQKINERWGFNTSLDHMGVKIPDGYSDQAFDYQTFTNQAVKPDTLGVNKIKAKDNQIFIQYNVTPKLGRIDVIYVDQLEHVISNNTYYSPVGTKFNENKYLPDNSNLIVKVLYPKYSIPAFTDQNQTLIIQSYIKPVQSFIIIKYFTTDNQMVNGVSEVSAPSGTEFNINNCTKNVPDGYKYINCYNPSNITIFPRDSNSPHTIYFLVKPTKANEDKITIEFIDQHNKKVGSYEVFGNPYTLFNIISNLTLPDNCSLVSIETNQVEFLPQDQTVYVTVYHTTPTPATPSNNNSPINPVPANPGSAYVVYIDEDTDSSLNPCTFNASQTTEEQSQPQPQDDPQIIYMNNNPTQFNNMNNIKLNNIYYRGNPLQDGTLITGPNIYWKSYHYNMEYPNMFEYAVDSAKSPQISNIKGIPLVIIYCYPAFIKGITFQLVTIKHGSKFPVSNHCDLPKANRISFPKGWSIDIDPITHHESYTIPYKGTTTTNYFLHCVFGGSHGIFQDSQGHTWKASNNRKITFTQPYAYMINVNQKS